MERWLVVLTLGELVFVGWILWLISSYKIRKSKERSEERLRILERFGSNEELTSFLATDAGDKLLANFAPNLAPKPSDRRSNIVIGLACGLGSLFVGTGFLMLAWLNVFNDPDVFLIPGVLLGFVGAGTLVSVAVSIRLLRRMNGDAD